MITHRPACQILHGQPTARCTARVDKYFVDYYTVQLMDRGAVELFYDQRRHVLERPYFWFCRPGPRIRFHAWKTETWSHRYFAFTGALPRLWLRQGLIGEEPVPCPAWAVPENIRKMEEIGRLREANDSLSSWRAINLLENLLLGIESLRHHGSRKTFWAERVGERWRSAMRRPVDYAALARKEGVALSTFRRLFRQENGMGPHQYLQRLRIEEARLLLEKGEKNQKEIAEALGYTDVYHFNRDFRKRVGLPPSQYQNSLLGKS